MHDLRPNTKNVLPLHELEHDKGRRYDTYKERELSRPSLIEEEATIVVPVPHNPANRKHVG